MKISPSFYHISTASILTLVLASLSSSQGLTMGENKFSEQFAKLLSSLNEAQKDNVGRVSLYRDAEFFRQKVTVSEAGGNGFKITKQQAEELYKQIDDLESKLQLIPLHKLKKRNILAKVYSVFRFTGVVCFMLHGGVFSIFLMVLEQFEKMIGVPRDYQLSCRIKSFMSWFFFAICGLGCVVHNYVAVKRLDGPALLMFNHQSNMDAFALPLTFPWQLKCVAKKELFMVPFLGWLSIAFGAIPINRKSRSQAIQALEAAGAAVERHGDCMAISPEGTRSKTGLLMPFKKGPFYLMQALQMPLVPALIYGSYETWPSKAKFCCMGQIHVRYLDPLPPGALGPDRDAAAAALRRRMLAALPDIPEGAGKPLTLRQWVDHIMATVALWSFAYIEAQYLKLALAKWGLNLFHGFVLMWVAALPVGITIYFLYVKVIYRQGSAKPDGKQ